MASPSTTTRGSIQLEGVIGGDGRALIVPEINVATSAATSNNREEVAPWLEPPSPPSPPSPHAPTSKFSRTFGNLPQKISFNSLRQNSYPNGNPPSHHQSRPSESLTTSSKSSDPDSYVLHGYQDFHPSSPPYQSSLSAAQIQQPLRELRKAKSTTFPGMIKNLLPTSKKPKVSRSRATSNADEEQHPSLKPAIPPLPDHSLNSARTGRAMGFGSGMKTEPSSPQNATFFQHHSHPRDPSIGRDSKRKFGRRSKRDDERGRTGGPPSVPPLPPSKEPEMEMTLDTNLDEMEGIVDQSVLNPSVSTPNILNNDAASSYTGTKSLSDRSISITSSYQSHLPPVHLDFRDPFTSPSTYTLNGVTRNAPPRKSSLKYTRTNPDASISPLTITGNEGIASSSQLNVRAVPHSLNGTSSPFSYIHRGQGQPDMDPKGKGKVREGQGDGNSQWEIPESWDVVDPHRPIEEEEYSSSEDSLGGTSYGGPLQFRNDQDRDSLTTPEADVLSEKGITDEFGLNGRCTYPYPSNGSLASIETAYTVQSGSTGTGTGSRKLRLFSNADKRKPSGKNSVSSSVSGLDPRHPQPYSPNSQHQPPPPHSLRPHHTSDNRNRRPSATTPKRYTIRIYRANGTYHVLFANFGARAEDLIPKLNSKLLPTEKEKVDTFQLYLQDRGRERAVNPGERPADLVRRRLEQAGYDVSDGLELGGEGLSFLLKFVYKSRLLNTTQNLVIDNYEAVDLSKRHLRTIPPILHQHASDIITLNLSRNHNLEIPTDFIQACDRLTELRLSEMAYKRVPHSLKHCVTLSRLDVSGNRISDLDQPFLDALPELRVLYVQNNRLESLPWHFPKLKSLTNLNISNNKFKVLPHVVCDLKNLRDLDISFNMIEELPEEIGRLQKLEHLIVTGNRLTTIPEDCSKLVSLRRLDCRRNSIADLRVIQMLPKLEKLSADWNALQELSLSIGPCVQTIDVMYNEVTRLVLASGPVGHTPNCLTSLDISHARLARLDDDVIEQLSSLKTLKLDYNQFHTLPEALGSLTRLETLSVADNHLSQLPESMGQLERLTLLDVHNNNLRELPEGLWNCGKLKKINATSNLLALWQYQPKAFSSADWEHVPDRKASASSLGGASTSSRVRPPLALSLEKLYLGENQFTDELLEPLTILQELRVLNLSFNEIQELPVNFLRNFLKLEELYLSGNKLTSIPTEDLGKMKKLNTMFLNGNKLQTLPQELGEVKSLTVLDVGSNLLKYNINNCEFDWNWNFNTNLKYLNLSGNKRLQIKSDTKISGNNRHSRAVSFGPPSQSLAGFTALYQLRVLGLMDVTITSTSMGVDLPDENEERRIRTSDSTVLGMGYGIADTLGKNEHLNMLDLAAVLPGREDEAVFAMFGRSQPPKAMAGVSGNRIAKYLRDKFVEVFLTQLQAMQQGQSMSVTDALRRSFLKLNQNLHDSLFLASQRKASLSSGTSGNQYNTVVNRGGASGIVLYFTRGKKMYVANTGNALAVVSRGGNAQPVSRKHDPYDQQETARIRSCEGWISPEGLVNNELDISRSFGFFHLMPIVNARPDVREWELTESDEFVIVGNRGLWDYVSYQTAVDIARQERADPMIAAQKLRDFALSYGAEGSTMIMVISVAHLFEPHPSAELPPITKVVPRANKEKTILDRELIRLGMEVPPPRGHLALVFTDIRNSTHLWEVNRGMNAAWRLHNGLLRRHLRLCGGYEVKTEGDAFMCAFPTTLAAVWWALVVQVELVNQSWPLEILECEDGQPINDSSGRLIAQGLSVRMGIHCGVPICEQDPVNHRMDYFGPVVNRSARVEGKANGGQIMCSAEVMKEINAKIFETEPPTPYSDLQPQEAIDGIRHIGIAPFSVGEVQLKGLELPDYLTVIYPAEFEGRHFMQETVSNPDPARVQFDVQQIRHLGLVCLRLEALASNRIFREIPAERKSSAQTVNGEEEEETPLYLYGNPDFLLPPLSETASDKDIMVVLDAISGRIENAASRIRERKSMHDSKQSFMAALKLESQFDERTLESILNILEGL
ncbi:PP2C-domain-containing protein [Marasmius fiardii PR-910]|nr:PP2C-domain-containing protein [Marasmius fiardii PR-910]